MSRYSARAYIADDLGREDGPMLPEIAVPTAAPVDTGLLDDRGNRIWRLPNPIGFGRDGEW